MVTLADFDEVLDKKILQRGKDYMDEDRILQLEEVDKDVFCALVEGTEDYHVEISLSPEGEILDHDCDCPYDWGEYCKHTAAVLYAIRKRQADQAVGLQQPPFLRDVIQKIPRSELEQLLLQVCRRDALLRTRLLMDYGDENPSPAGIRELVEAGIRPYAYSGYVAYGDVGKAMSGAKKALDIILKEQNILCKIGDALTLLAVLLPFLEMCDDSDGIAGGYIGEAMKAVEEVLDSLDPCDEEAENILMEILTFLEDQMSADWYGIQYELAEALIPFAASPRWRTELEQVLEHMLQRAKEKGPDSWSLQTVMRLRLKLLLEAEDEEGAARLLQENLNLTPFREAAIRKALEEQNWNRAADLAKDGIKTDQADYWKADKWRQYLLKSAEGAGDKKTIREQARILCLNGDFNYYGVYKNTFSSEAWQDELNKLLQLIASQKPGRQIYVQILLEEKRRDLLLQYCQRYPLSIFRYYSELEAYPEQVDALFQSVLLQNAARACDRQGYRRVCDSIKVYAKACGKQNANALADELRRKYLRRPAFLDELGKI